MIFQSFLGHKPSKFHVNPIVRAFIISETFFWGGINFLGPVFAIFIANEVSGGSIEAAGTAATVYLLSRMVFELIAARSLNGASDDKKFVFAVVGILIVSIAYFGFVFASNITWVLILQALSGLGFGIVSPAKYVLFSEHLDKGKESTEWGVYDAVSMGGMALTAMLGGYVAQEYGFNVLFVVAGFLILLGAMPFTLFVWANRGIKKQ
ncbi:MFS transporter [bacterium]|uniref:Major facilitator superfamily (MFS) profile domain-containing protein n=2 Tax=Katanobacteria TaxID=422282 RepID=A0A2M7X2C7_UNCKA|nr:MFS transporter [bacterium]PIP56703.1 MAG: hypothetical protein COX05_01645 [candidate division WWE3 bacterium CG22_combo_CG10-13_8_21_14_all_39_12]PJA40320.1 MAG: hypothetical protein CO179_02665 [candidate division WWE3 bacterium CG_4_9_14_3_um_filter_39_7]